MTGEPGANEGLGLVGGNGAPERSGGAPGGVVPVSDPEPAESAAAPESEGPEIDFKPFYEDVATWEPPSSENEQTEGEDGQEDEEDGWWERQAARALATGGDAVIPGGELVGIGPGNTPFVSMFKRQRIFGHRVRSKDLLRSSSFEGITGWKGLPGVGKTYALVEALTCFAALGVPVYTNGLDFLFEAGSFRDFDELCAIIDDPPDDEPLRVLAIDEAPFWANARKWQEFPDDFFRRLMQVRKYGYLLYYTAIREEMIDANLRRVTYWMWDCNRTLFLKRFQRSLYPPMEEQTVAERPVVRRKVWPRQGVFEAYDTHKRLALPGEEVRYGPLGAQPGELVRVPASYGTVRRL